MDEENNQPRGRVSKSFIFSIFIVAGIIAIIAYFIFSGVLNQSKEMPLDTLKIDKSFVDNIGTDKENEKDLIVLKHIISLAKNLSFNSTISIEEILKRSKPSIFRISLSKSEKS